MQSRLDLRRCIDLNDACVLWCTIAELDGPGFERLINDLRLGVLGEEEFERVLRYRVLNDRRRSLLSVLLVKFALMSYYGISPIEVKIVREGGLKPFFKFSTEEIRQIHFNVSHDEEVVIVILSKYEVGIDIMKSELPLRSRRPESSVEESTERFLNNMRSTFQPSEWEYIQRDISRFMHYWTIKESFVKYTGMGLYIDPKRLLIISNRTAGDCSSSDPNLTSLEKTRICMDNEVQSCEIYSSNTIITDYYVSFCLPEARSENPSAHSSGPSIGLAERTGRDIKLHVQRLSIADLFLQDVPK